MSKTLKTVQTQINTPLIEEQYLNFIYDWLPIGIIFLNSIGQVIGSNTRARQALSEKDGLQLVRGELACSSNGDTYKLRNAIGDKLVEVEVEVEDRTNSTPNFLHINKKLHPSTFSVAINFMPRSYVNNYKDCQAKLMVLIIDRSNSADISISHLSEEFGLSNREAHVCANLVKGYSVTEIAELNRVKTETVRSHLKSIFHKTDSRSQSDLMNLILTGITVWAIE